MKPLRFLFMILIGMISFTGLRAETPDLKVNSTEAQFDAVDQVGQFEFVASNVSTEISIIQSIPNLDHLFDVSVSSVEVSNDYNFKNQTFTAFQNYNYKHRKARDGLSY